MKKKTIMAVLIGLTVIMTQQRIIVLAATTSGDRQSSTVSATVPDKHTITIDKDAHVTITYEDSKDEGEGDAFPIERFSTPTFTIETEDGWEIDKILLDGVDITSQLSNKKLTLPSVYQNETLKISTKIKPAYTVVIPQDTNVQFNKLTENFGKISMEKVWLEDGKCIEVSMSSAGNLTNQKDSSKLIPYQILEEGKDTLFTSAKYTAQGEETSLLIDIKQDDWNKAASGSYSDTVTFTISYADSE